MLKNTMLKKVKVEFSSKIVLSLLAVGFVLSEQANLSAQESNYKFYPHNYALSPLDGKDAAISATPNPKMPSNGKTKNPTNSGSKNTAPINELRGKPIESISVILNHLDFKVFKNSLELLLEIYNEKSVRPSTLFLLGLPAQSYTNELRLLLERTTMLGVVQKITNEPPSNFKVSKVPAWILTTKEGDIVLEGLDSPQKFINSKGEFIDPKDVVGDDVDLGLVGQAK